MFTCIYYWILMKTILLGKSEETVRKRKSNGVNEEEEKKQISFDIEENDSFVTDFNKDGSFQKTVQFSMDQTFLATGGADGFLRVWKVCMIIVYFIVKHLSSSTSHSHI